MHDARRPSARLVATVALACFTAGAVASAAALVGRAPEGTVAGLFAAPVVDLRLTSDGRVDGFIGNGNLAPGDVVRGSLRVVADGVAPGQAVDLDLDVRTAGLERKAGLADAFVATRLVYGADDLLAPGGRDLVREIDRNPLVGNGDGRLSLRELDVGANDLPAPTSAGTGLAVEFRLDPKSTAQGQRADVAFVFRLADRMDADLN